MQINDALNTGVQGFQNAQSRATQAATEIASQSAARTPEQTEQNNQLVNSLVELKTAEIDANANAKVIQTASDVLGSIIDIKV